MRPDRISEADISGLIQLSISALAILHRPWGFRMDCSTIQRGHCWKCKLLESCKKAVYAVSTVRLVGIHGELRMKRAGLWAARATSIVCLLLLTWMAFIQVTHVHPVASDTDHCPICVAMHSAAPAAVVVEPIQLVSGPETLPVPVTRSVIRRWPFTLFNRPPPEQL